MLELFDKLPEIIGNAIGQIIKAVAAGYLFHIGWSLWKG